MVESFITTLCDLFPKWFRAPMKHELFALAICAVSYLTHITLVTEVSRNLVRNSNRTTSHSKHMYFLS